MDMKEIINRHEWLSGVTILAVISTLHTYVKMFKLQNHLRYDTALSFSMQCVGCGTYGWR